MIRVLLNCSTLVKGGALQAAVSFVRTALDRDDSDIQWHFILSKNVADELIRYGIASNISSVTLINASPARSYQSRKTLRNLEQTLNPDVIFTLFGPAYVDFKSPHLCGVADGWVTHGGYWAWKTMQSAHDAIRSLALILYKAYMYRKADAWVTEALIAKEGLIRRLHIDSKKIAVVPNSCGTQYLNSGHSRRFPLSGEQVRILCMSAFYRHKNLEIIPAVAKELEAVFPELRFEFVLTLPQEGDGIRKIMKIADALGVRDRIVNAGYIPVSQGPDLYRSCHILFLPSVLETSSANYPEAMAMGLPIVTVGLNFAESACGSAAVYFEPMNHVSAALAITRLCKSEPLWDQLVQDGKEILHTLPTSTDRYELYKKYIKALLHSKKHVDFSTVQEFSREG